MKTITKVTLIATGLTIAAVPLVSAAVARHARHHARLEHKALRERAAGKRALSAEQRATLRALRDKVATSLKALRADPNLTREQKKAKARELVESTRNEIRADLNREQLQKLHHLREHRRDRRAPDSAI